MSTVVLVHGAWHGAWCWYKLIPLLEQAGHRVLALDLPSHGIDKTPAADVTMQSYVDRLCRLIDTCAEQVVLVGHSLGGAVITETAEARPEKITKLVYLAAFLAPNGRALLRYAQQDDRSLLLPHLVFSADQRTMTLKLEMIQAVFYADCDASDVALARLLLTPQSAAVLATPIRSSAAKWGRVPRHYIECTDDRAVSVGAQRAMYAELPCQRVLSLATSHSPFFSAPRALADRLQELL
jgi:pimeloyl-ACP methyl ester carboxylesterase